MFSLEDASWVGMSGAQRKSSTMVLPRKYQMFPLSSPAKDKVKVNSRPTSNSEEVAQQNLMKLLIFDVNKNRDLERWSYVVVLSISRVWEKGTYRDAASSLSRASSGGANSENRQTEMPNESNRNAKRVETKNKSSQISWKVIECVNSGKDTHSDSGTV